MILISNNFQTIATEYKEALLLMKKKSKKNFSIFNLILIVLLIIFGVLYSQAIVFLVFFNIILATFLFSVLLYWFDMRNFSRKKVFFGFLYERIIEAINADLSTKYGHITYESFPKTKHIVKKGGLFTKQESAKSNCTMMIKPEDGHPIHLFDLLLETRVNVGYTSQRKVNFKGMYFVIKLEKFTVNTYFQIRSKGTPKFSGIKLKKIKTQDDLKEYVDPNGSGSIEAKYYTLYDHLKGKYPKSKVYISGVDDVIHVAISDLEIISKLSLSKISPEKIQKVSDDIHSIIDLAAEISRAI